MALRSALVEHMRSLGPRLLIEKEFFKDYFWVQGTRPMDDQTMSSVEMFHILERTNYHIFREPFSYETDDSDIPVRVTNNDGSYILGPGACNAAVVEKVQGLIMWDQSVEDNDCFLAVTSILKNLTGVKRVMRHSLQPVTSLAGPEELVEDFGIDRVARALEISGTHSRVDSIQDRRGPRVLYCADSVQSEICKSMKRVFSSEGISIALNAAYQKDHLTERFKNTTGSTLLTDHPIPM